MSGQSEGRDRNGAISAVRPDASTPDRKVEAVGRQGTRKAGPDGPDAAEAARATTGKDRPPS